MNYKNRKPKSYRGCCGMCALRKSDGRRNGRKLSVQERLAPGVTDFDRLGFGDVFGGAS